MEILIKNESKKSTYVNPRKKFSNRSQNYRDDAPVLETNIVPETNENNTPTKVKGPIAFTQLHKRIRRSIIYFFFVTIILDVTFSLLYYLKVFNVNMYINLASGIVAMALGVMSLVVSIANTAKMAKSKMPRKVLPIILLVITYISAINLIYSGFMIGPALLIFR